MLRQPGQAKWDDGREPLTEFGDRDWSRQFHIGGTSGGDSSSTEFPARLEVDYVRV